MAPPFRDNSRGKGTVMDWARILAYVTGTVDQELLARNEYLVCTEILNSGVVVMESAKDGARIDDTGSLNRARDRRILVQ
jgi:hypothetical protein